MADKTTCGVCEHWENEINPDFPNDPDNDWGHCELGRSSDGEPSHKRTLAYAGDCESYGAFLKTRRDFGCVQYEKKNQKK